MKNTKKIGLVGIFVAIFALNPPVEAAPTNQATPELKPTIEDRLAKISATIRERENQLPQTPEELIARGWANGSSGRGWVNANRRRWSDGRNRRGWINNNRWRNNWRDGGSFSNRW